MNEGARTHTARRGGRNKRPHPSRGVGAPAHTPMLCGPPPCKPSGSCTGGGQPAGPLRCSGDATPTETTVSPIRREPCVRHRCHTAHLTSNVAVVLVPVPAQMPRASRVPAACSWQVSSRSSSTCQMSFDLLFMTPGAQRRVRTRHTHLDPGDVHLTPHTRTTLSRAGEQPTQLTQPCNYTVVHHCRYTHVHHFRYAHGDDSTPLAPS